MGKGWKTGLGASVIHISTLSCCLGKTFIFFIYLGISCLLLNVDSLLSLTSLQYLNITSKLHHCTGLSSWAFVPNFQMPTWHMKIDNAIDLQMQVWHMKIEMQLIFRLDRAKFLFQNLPDLFCLPITWHHLHSPNHPDRNYRIYFRLCFLSIHQNKTSGQILLQILS